MDHAAPTPHPDVNGVISELVRCVGEALGDDFVGAYLVGSLATGDWDIDSDIDFIIVTAGELTDEQVRSLQKTHPKLQELDCVWAKHLEGSYIPMQLFRQRRTVGITPVWFLDHGSRSLELSDHDNQWHVFWVLRERGIVVAGPDPKELVDPIPPEALGDEILSLMSKIKEMVWAERHEPPAYWNTRFGQPYAVMTYCRMLQTLATATVQSKRAGVEWALATLDPRWRGLIQRALDEREGVRFCIKIGRRADSAEIEQTLEFIDYAIECSQRYA